MIRAVSNNIYRDVFAVHVGAIVDVKGTKFDLTEDTDLGKRIPEVPGNFGFDHTFCLEKPGWKKHAAKYAIISPLSTKFCLYIT